MERLLNHPTYLFDCSKQIQPFKCKRCPHNFETNFLASLRHHVISGHIKEDPEEKIYKCLRCSVMRFSRYLHLRHGLMSQCTTPDEEEKLKRFVCYRDDQTEFSLIKDKLLESPQENRQNVDLLESGHSVNSTAKSSEKACKESVNHSKFGWCRDCAQCPFKSRQKGNLKTHIQNQHSRPEDIHWFECDQCSFKSRQKGNLKTHIQNQHSRPEDIHWFECDKSKQKGHLKRHLSAHSRRVKFYACANCLSPFTTKTRMKNHVKRCTYFQAQ